MAPRDFRRVLLLSRLRPKRLQRPQAVLGPFAAQRRRDGASLAIAESSGGGGGGGGGSADRTTKGTINWAGQQTACRPTDRRTHLIAQPLEVFDVLPLRRAQEAGSQKVGVDARVPGRKKHTD